MALAVVGEVLALVGPLTSAITQIIDLSKRFQGTANVATSDTHSDFNNKVVVGIGVWEGGTEDNFGGDGLQISGFSGQSSFIGSGKMPHMNQGQSSVTGLDSSESKVGAINAEQLTIQASGADAVCVQYVELIWQGTVYSGFDGSFGQMCGQEWFYSSSSWGQTTDGQPYKPACFWMDGTSVENPTKQHPNTAMWVDMSMLLSGAEVPGDNTTVNTFCKPEVMKFSSTGVDHDSPNVPSGLNKDKAGKGPVKREFLPGRFNRRIATGTTTSGPTGAARVPIARGTGAAAPFPMPNGTDSRYAATGTTASKPAATGSFMSADGTLTQLIISDFSDHPASILCNHEKSRGPDFVSTSEELFCDMELKILYPLCTVSQKSNCFAVDKDQKKIKKRGDDESGSNDALHRGYRAVTHWQA